MKLKNSYYTKIAVNPGHHVLGAGGLGALGAGMKPGRSEEDFIAGRCYYFLLDRGEFNTISEGEGKSRIQRTTYVKGVNP